jgi:hypothetical protein
MDNEAPQLGTRYWHSYQFTSKKGSASICNDGGMEIYTKHLTSPITLEIVIAFGGDN